MMSLSLEHHLVQKLSATFFSSSSSGSFGFIDNSVYRTLEQQKKCLDQEGTALPRPSADCRKLKNFDWCSNTAATSCYWTKDFRGSKERLHSPPCQQLLDISASLLPLGVHSISWFSCRYLQVFILKPSVEHFFDPDYSLVKNCIS